MSTLLNPAVTATFDAATTRIVITFRDGRASQVVELDPDQTPAFINALMEARSQANLSALLKKGPRTPPPAKKFVQNPGWTRKGRPARL